MNNLMVRFGELEDYDEFEIERVRIADGEEKKYTFLCMKIPFQNCEHPYNAVGINDMMRINLNQLSMVKPLIYKKLSMAKEEKSDRKHMLDRKYKYMDSDPFKL